MGNTSETPGLIPENLYAMDERATAGQLALEVMHDLRNPLEAIGHLVFLTRHDAGNAELVTKYMEFAEAAKTPRRYRHHRGR